LRLFETNPVPGGSQVGTAAPDDDDDDDDDGTSGTTTRTHAARMAIDADVGRLARVAT
jgi:hypothetical protein|tara:strand:+ start:3943 stop:4116 length:174 start_codon:yes stop_codon:yes gene_type:complete